MKSVHFIYVKAISYACLKEFSNSKWIVIYKAMYNSYTFF